MTPHDKYSWRERAEAAEAWLKREEEAHRACLERCESFLSRAEVAEAEVDRLRALVNVIKRERPMLVEARLENQRLRAALEATINLERQSHRLWDQAWLVLIGNPSDAAREEAEQATLQATRLHRQAIDLSGVNI